MRGDSSDPFILGTRLDDSGPKRCGCDGYPAVPSCPQVVPEGAPSCACPLTPLPRRARRLQRGEASGSLASVSRLRLLARRSGAWRGAGRGSRGASPRAPARCAAATQRQSSVGSDAMARSEAKLLSRMVAPVYTPSSSAGGSLLSNVPTKFYIILLSIFAILTEYKLVFHSI